MKLEVHNAPRGTKQVLFNGEWREVVRLESDTHPVTTRRSNNKTVHGNAVRSAKRILRMEPKKQKEVITKDLIKKKLVVLKVEKGIQRITPKIRAVYKEFLVITEKEIQSEIGRLARIAFES